MSDRSTPCRMTANICSTEPRGAGQGMSSYPREAPDEELRKTASQRSSYRLFFPCWVSSFLREARSRYSLCSFSSRVCSSLRCLSSSSSFFLLRFLSVLAPACCLVSYSFLIRSAQSAKSPSSSSSLRKSGNHRKKKNFGLLFLQTYYTLTKCLPLIRSGFGKGKEGRGLQLIKLTTRFSYTVIS